MQHRFPMTALRMLIAALLCCIVALSTAQASERHKLIIKTASDQFAFHVEIADTEPKRTQGLMYRRDMARDHGMLFTYTYDLVMSFWMKNTYIPLDLIFIDKTGKITGFHKNAVPHSLADMSSVRPVRAVLEINAGLVDALGIKAGDQIIYAPLRWGS